jgi:hypothetical protein
MLTNIEIKEVVWISRESIQEKIEIDSKEIVEIETNW